MQFQKTSDHENSSTRKQEEEYCGGMCEGWEASSKKARGITEHYPAFPKLHFRLPAELPPSHTHNEGTIAPGSTAKTNKITHSRSFALLLHYVQLGKSKHRLQYGAPVTHR